MMLRRLTQLEGKKLTDELEESRRSSRSSSDLQEQTEAPQVIKMSCSS